jgi:hypothetical protein
MTNMQRLHTSASEKRLVAFPALVKIYTITGVHFLDRYIRLNDNLLFIGISTPKRFPLIYTVYVKYTLTYCFGFRMTEKTPFSGVGSGLVLNQNSTGPNLSLAPLTTGKGFCVQNFLWAGSFDHE